MQVGSSRGCSHWSTNVTEIGQADAVNTILSQYGDFVADSVLYREPVEDITEDRGDMAELPRTNQESRSSVQDFLKSMNFSFRNTV